MIYPPSELIINADGSAFHLHIRPEQLADRVILVGDPGRVETVASHFDSQECNISSREFHTITGTYKGKRITVLSTGIGCDNIDIVVNELDALANINFETREDNPTFRQLTLVRIGTCGGLQPETPLGTFVASEKSIGFDGLLNYFLRYPDYILFRCSLLSYAVLIMGDADDLDELTRRSVEIISQRCQGAEAELNWYVAVGSPTYRLSGLPQCYADTNHVLAYRHIMQCSVIQTGMFLHAASQSKFTVKYA